MHAKTYVCLQVLTVHGTGRAIGRNSVDMHHLIWNGKQIHCTGDGWTKPPSEIRFRGVVMNWVRSVVICAVVAFSFSIPLSADPAIWHLSDGDSDIYLFGTVHILPPDLEWRSEEINAAFESADTVWFEAPASDPALMGETLQLIQQHGLNTPGNPLSAQISAEAQAKLDSLAAKIGIPAIVLEPMRPWLASVTISVAYIQTQGYQPESGVESILWPEANDSGKELSYFETLEEQVRFFADLSPEVEAEYFEETLKDFDRAAGELDVLVSAWAEGDVATIDAVMNGETRDAAPEAYDVLIVERNQKWIETIKEVLAGSGTHFIAVGAGHLAGPQGVVELLRAEGLEIEGP